MARTTITINSNKLPTRFKKLRFNDVFGYLVFTGASLQHLRAAVKEYKREVKRFIKMHHDGIVGADRVVEVECGLKLREQLLAYMVDNQIDLLLTGWDTDGG